jgi:hypothetical protein
MMESRCIVFVRDHDDEYDSRKLEEIPVLVLLSIQFCRKCACLKSRIVEKIKVEKTAEKVV